MSKEAIQYELRDAIHEHGPDCIILMGDADFVDLLKRFEHLLFYQTEASDPKGEIQYLGVRVLTNNIPGTHGYIVGSVADMEPWLSCMT